jgi:hypothetical protein
LKKRTLQRLESRGELAKRLENEADTGKEFIKENHAFLMREYSQAISQVRISTSVPLKLPNSVVELLKKNKLEKISVAPNFRTKA